MALPHITNSTAGRNKFDPVHNSIFEVKFTVPEALRAEFGKDEMLITEHVLSVTGLEALNKNPDTGEQKFMGTTRSFINPTMDSTSAEITIKFTLNLRDDVDNYIYKLFKAWGALGYDKNTGTRALKREYCADWFGISVANRRGDIYHEVIFKDIMISGAFTGYGDGFDYTNNEAAELDVKFKSDWWQETML